VNAEGNSSRLSLSSGAGFFREPGLAGYFKGSLGIEEAIQLEELGNKSGPAGLVTGTQPGAIVAVEAFKEVDVVAPERVALELFRRAVDGSPAALVAQEDPGQPVRDLLADLKEVHQAMLRVVTAPLAICPYQGFCEILSRQKRGVGQ
jgi:hypothetical protein